MDLMAGQVVRGVGGKRDKYRPLQSVLAADARPETVGRALVRMGFQTIYVADLDAIGGAAPAWDIYRQLSQCGARLWVDSGIKTSDQAYDIACLQLPGQAQADPCVEAVIAALETLPSPAVLADICATVKPDRLVFSLDLRNGAPLGSSSEWRDMTPLDIAQCALQVGIRRLIVLDLAQVGMDQGLSTLALCRALKRIDSDIELTSGGGVRSLDDLRALADCGCDAALVASALYDGRLKSDQLLNGI